MDVDIDNDFDGKLLDQFRSMGTTDRDVLISQFQNVLGNNINPELCAFFLDMNNWNLQNAVCSYYDFEQPASSLPSMSIVADITVAEGEAVAPNTAFCKSWRIKNSGNERWPPGCHLRFCSGHNLSSVERKIVESLVPGEPQDVSIDMKSPSSAGTYLSLWRLCTPTGVYFGDVLNINIVVAEDGLLALTQQLSRIGGTATNNQHHLHSSPLQLQDPGSRLASPMQHSNLSVSTPLQQDQHFPSIVIAEDPAISKCLSSSVPVPFSLPCEDDTEMSS